MKFFANISHKIRKIFIGYVTPRCVGIDISSTAVKMLELMPDSLKIHHYNISPLNKNMVIDGVINDIDSVSDIIRQQWTKLNSTYSEVAISIPYNAVVLREVTAPLFASKYDLDDYIKNQLVRELDNEEIDFDYLVKSKTDENQILSVVVAKKEKIEEYQAIIQMTGMRVAAIDIEPFAIQYLFESVLLRSIPEFEQVVIIDIGSNRMRAFVFIEQKLILFNEISSNYLSYFEEVISQGTGNSPELNLYRQSYQMLLANPTLGDELKKVIAADVAKLLQMLKSGMLVEKNIGLMENAKVYLIGGNSLIPGVYEEISKLFSTRVSYATDLLGSINNNVPEADLLRLFTAIALATWGHKIDKN